MTRKSILDPRWAAVTEAVAEWGHSLVGQYGPDEIVLYVLDELDRLNVERILEPYMEFVNHKAIYKGIPVRFDVGVVSVEVDQQSLGSRWGTLCEE